MVDGLRVIRKGLAPNENVIINGLMRLRPGIKVAPTLTTMEPSDSGRAQSAQAPAAATEGSR